MMQTFMDALSSKKAWALAIGLASSFLAVNLGLDQAVVEKLIEAIVILVSSYMVGQGIADHGKEAEKVKWAVGVLRGTALEAMEAAREKLNTTDQPDS